MDFATPPRGGKEALISAAEKKSMLDNLDLEVNDRTKSFRSHLDDLLTSFEIRQESAIMCIPKNLRNLSMKEMNELWGGDWSTTLRKLAEKTLENQNRVEKDKFDDAVQQVVDDERKRRASLLPACLVPQLTDDLPIMNPFRKRGETSRSAETSETESGPIRKSTRTQSATTAMEKPATLASLASKGKRILSGKKAKTTVSTTPAVKRSTRGDSILVQSRPVLTPSSSSLNLTTRTRSAVPSSAKFEPPTVTMTPKEPRTLKENEFILSANGSPVTNPWKGTPHAGAEQEHSYQMPGQYEVGTSTDEDDENELPDVAEMERRLLAKSGRGNAAGTSAKSSSLSRGKRMSTIRIRQSISQPSLGPQRSTDPSDPFALPSMHQTPRPLYPNHLFKSASYGESSPGMSNRGAMIRVTTDAGLTIDFDPLSDDPTRVQDELIRNGVDESTRLQVRQEMAKRIRELQERLASWKI
ncbi:hypothetical protein QFC22_004668 [Naganishia vaughanmartiniae]|uniref:Uncharacterized protein n=1 Tax=Naganishia vaughanmartiniae TaxID=1424756 RepID=A0ACC2WYZ9_9TREE|nr:hypothetical protein QFC22_004668 [Naganishia vaughanmartiniae]